MTMRSEGGSFPAAKKSAICRALCSALEQPLGTEAKRQRSISEAITERAGDDDEAQVITVPWQWRERRCWFISESPQDSGAIRILFRHRPIGLGDLTEDLSKPSPAIKRA